MDGAESIGLDKESLRVLSTALDRMEAGFAALPPVTEAPVDVGAVERRVRRLADFIRADVACQRMSPETPE